MLSFILRRLGYGFLILLGVNLITFVLFFAVNTPDDMARLNIGGKRVTPEQIEKWKAERGYNKSLLNKSHTRCFGTDRCRSSCSISAGPTTTARVTLATRSSNAWA